MKFSIFLILVVSLFLINGVIAISSDLKQDYSPGETALVKIEGNILEPITYESVEFKRGNVLVPIEYDIKKLGEDYYLWFNTPLEGSGKNYTLIIKDISTTELGQTKKLDFKKNFSVSGNITEYTIKPGFIIERDNFTIDITLNRDENKNIVVSFPTKTEYTIKPGKNTIFIDLKSIKLAQLIYIDVGEYRMPVYVLRKNSDNSFERKNNSLSLNPININSLELISEKDIGYTISFSNNGNNKIEDIYLEYDQDYFDVSSNKKIDLLPGESGQINLSINERIKVNISQTVYLKSTKNNISLSIPVDIRFVNSINEIDLDNESSVNYEERYCDFITGGKRCSRAQKCIGNLTSALDGDCCIGICETQSRPSESSFIGYLIMGVAIIVIVFLFVKYKKAKPNKTILEKTLDEDENLKNKKKVP